LHLTKIAIIFPPGRKFASFKQLKQACEMFLEAWAVVEVHSQKTHQDKTKLANHSGEVAQSY
jgi:hypothetical protein